MAYYITFSNGSNTFVCFVFNFRVERMLRHLLMNAISRAQHVKAFRFILMTTTSTSLFWFRFRCVGENIYQKYFPVSPEVHVMPSFMGIIQH